MKELDVIQPVLTRLLQEREQVEQQIVKEGTVPKELCRLCEGEGRKRWIVPLTEDEKKGLEKFLEWVKQNKIVSVKLESPTYISRVSLEATQPVGRKKPDTTKDGRYSYSYYPSEFQKRAFYTDTLAKFQEIDSCSHFNVDEGEIIHLHKVRRLGTLDSSHRESVDVLFLCCRKCREEIDKRQCDSGVRKSGFTYSFSCDLDTLLLKKILEETEIPFELGEVDERFLFPRQPQFFIRQHGILITERSSYRKLEEATVSQLNPKLIVYFGDKSEITELLEFKTNILIVTKDGEFYLYDHTKPIEESVDKIIDMIVKKLDNYAEKIRGNEHDRVVKAFAKIGQELGYIPEKEHSKKGVRVDCVWHDREGKIKVAIEVETRGGWKKDILSTWELEPELSIIVTYQKTDSVPKALMDFALMKSLPHKLLYINMGTKNGFLFEKQQILKKYSLKLKEKKEKFAIKEI